MTCNIFDITDIPNCVLATLIDFIQSAINAPLLPFLQTIKMLLTQPANTAAFSALWAVIIYILSIFYGLFIMLAGFNFVISSYNAEKRERAKEWLQNTILMILFVQASYLIYTLVAQLASGLTSGIVSMIDPNFFLITIDNAVNVGLEILLSFVYFFVLLLTIVTFAINYFIASIGVIFFPFGIFFYFIPPLRDIGKFIISKITFILFLPFFASIIFLGVSVLLNTTAFSSIKILFMISAFMAVNSLMIILALLAITRSVAGIMRSDIAKGVLFLKGHFPISTTQKQPPELHKDREYWGRVHNDHPNYERRR